MVYSTHKDGQIGDGGSGSPAEKTVQLHLALRAVTVHPSGVRIETGDLTAGRSKNRRPFNRVARSPRSVRTSQALGSTIPNFIINGWYTPSRYIKL